MLSGTAGTGRATGMVYPDFSKAVDTLSPSLSPNQWKFADNTKLRGTVTMLYLRAALQRNLDRVEKQSDRHLMKFIKRKCQVLHPG